MRANYGQLLGVHHSMLPIWAILLMHDDSCRQGTKDHTRMLHEQPARKQARCGHTCSQASWPRNCQVFTMIWPLKEWILKLQVMITNTLLTTSSANASKKSPNVHNSSRNHPRPNAWKNRRCSFAKMLFGSSISGYKFLVNVRLDLSCWEPLTKAIPKSSTFKSCRTFSCIFSEVEGCWLLTVYLVAEGCWLVRESIAFKNLGVHGPRDERLLWFCELWILDTQLQLNMFRLQHIRKATKRNQVVNMICILFQSPKIYSPHTKMATRQQMVSRLDHFTKHSNGNRWNLTGTSPS